MNAEDIDALNGHPSDRWLAHKGARLMGKWLIGEDPIELRDPAHRTDLAAPVQLVLSDSLKVQVFRGLSRELMPRRHAAHQVLRAATRTQNLT